MPGLFSCFAGEGDDDESADDERVDVSEEKPLLSYDSDDSGYCDQDFIGDQMGEKPTDTWLPIRHVKKVRRIRRITCLRSVYRIAVERIISPSPHSSPTPSPIPSLPPSQVQSDRRLAVAAKTIPSLNPYRTRMIKHWDKPTDIIAIPPAELYYDCCDIFLIHCECDIEPALAYMQDLMSSDIVVPRPDPRLPRPLDVLICSELQQIDSSMDGLKVGCKLATYVFVFITANFLACDMRSYITNTLIKASAASSTSSRTGTSVRFVPVITDENLGRSLELGAMRSLYYLNGGVETDGRSSYHNAQVQALFDPEKSPESSRIRSRKEICQENLRDRWLREKRPLGGASVSSLENPYYQQLPSIDGHLPADTPRIPGPPPILKENRHSGNQVSLY